LAPRRFARRPRRRASNPTSVTAWVLRRSTLYFAIEVINKHGDIDKLEIYRRLKVSEV
jgi:hypothetical protein